MVPVPKETVMAIEAYRSQAQVLVKSYLFADPFVPYTSVLGGVVACKVIYDITQLISTFYIKTYSGLTRIQRIEWNNRSGRNSFLTSHFLAVSVGYFLADLGMILWFYPSLGGMEYVFHHCLSAIAVGYSMLSGEGQLYTYMCLISEVTTPEINMRWYLDISGMKRSTAYLVNGVLIFIFWFIARVLLFFYIFYHINMHFDQVVQMMWFGCAVVVLVPSALFIMNLMWFAKIIKGLLKILAKRQ
ncbi:TLC domain-containing protein 4-B [Linum perenne]